MIFADEFENLDQKLTGLRRILIFTHPGDGKQPARLNLKTLVSLLAECDSESSVFICGPPRMMTRLKTDLKTIGFTSRSIFTERFG